MVCCEMLDVGHPQCNKPKLDAGDLPNKWYCTACRLLGITGRLIKMLDDQCTCLQNMGALWWGHKWIIELTVTDKCEIYSYVREPTPDKPIDTDCHLSTFKTGNGGEHLSGDG
jgi:hypothetical protein